MKKLLILLFFTLSICSWAQEQEDKTFTVEVEVLNAGKLDLNKSNEYVTRIFLKSKDETQTQKLREELTQLQRSESGIIFSESFDLSKNDISITVEIIERDITIPGIPSLFPMLLINRSDFILSKTYNLGELRSREGDIVTDRKSGQKTMVTITPH